MADATDYGLASHVHTRLGMCAPDGQRVGFGHDRRQRRCDLQRPSPFGDIKQSGTGREGGPEGPLEHPDVKYVKYAMFANSDSGAG
jgi:acyl-CoA reductase-like NAD-dependent aldehyde dehydrogenase